MILMYHNVWPEKSPNGHVYQSITLLDHEFETQILWLSKFFNIVSLSEYLCQTLSERKKNNCVAITFDDGTEITHDVVVPIIRKHGIPITIFVTTCQLDSGPLIWGAYLNALCHENGYHAVKNDDLILDLQTHAERNTARRLLEKKAIESGDPRGFVDQLSAKYPIPSEIIRFYRGMTSQQLEASRDNPLVEIGGHSVNHYFLGTLGDDNVRAEVTACKDTLTRLTGCEIDYFAYPYGDYDLRTIKYLKECGYAAGFAVNSRNLQDQSIYEVPRIGAYKTWKLMIKMVLYRLGLAYQTAAS